MPEIWVPYGPVEVSFDVKQENLSQILDPQPAKVVQEDFEIRLEAVTAQTVLLLSSTPGTQKILESLLKRNKGVRKILYPKNLGALARRKAQENSIQSEQLNPERLVAGTVEGLPTSIPEQLRDPAYGKILILTSAHYDVLFGLSSSASDLISLVPSLKSEAFKLGLEELPCNSPQESSASSYAIKLVQGCANIESMEIVERNSNVVEFFYGDVDDVHKKTIEFWKARFSSSIPSRAERVIFGCGGNENDRTLTDALSRSFFNVVSNFALPQSAKLCMLAECSGGLGSEAFLQFVTGRYIPGAKLDNVDYFDGLEVLLSFYKIQRGLELNIVTTLPRYFASKFEFKAYSAARDAPSSLVSSGSRAKILVIPDASTCIATINQITE